MTSIVEPTTAPTTDKAEPDLGIARARLRRRYLKAILPVLAVLVAAGVYLWTHSSPAPVQYVTATISRGPITRAIVATGTVNPVVTVQVGSYVSGTIIELHCDFNTEVKAHQLCAKIDPRPYQTIVEQDAANLASAKAQLRKDEAALAFAQETYHRDRGLVGQGIVSRETIDTDRNALRQAEAQNSLDRATIEQRAAELRAAKVNLGYTDIVSPVDGTVVSRNVDVGQTVAASFQTPTLFLVAKDLTKMQVDTNVSESDIGGAKEGASATFSVEAYPGEMFQGKIVQVRRAPISVQNVVTYDVVIGFDNADLRLIPGMTANARIVTRQRNDVLRVPMSALRYSPQSGKTDDAHRASATGSRIWLLRDGVPVAKEVQPGIDDGASVEVAADGLAEGDLVIVGEAKGAAKKAESGPGHAPTPRF